MKLINVYYLLVKYVLKLFFGNLKENKLTDRNRYRILSIHQTDNILQHLLKMNTEK